MQGWASDRARKHTHHCACGESIVCYNPACTEPEQCRACFQRELDRESAESYAEYDLKGDDDD